MGMHAETLACFAHRADDDGRSRLAPKGQFLDPLLRSAMHSPYRRKRDHPPLASEAPTIDVPAFALPAGIVNWNGPPISWPVGP
jgi:hypothetical protein